MRLFGLVLKATLVGALLGAVLVGWFSPAVITWYFSPPVDLAVNCKPAIEWGLDVFRKTMLLGAGVGGLIGLLVALAFRKGHLTK